MSFSVYQARKIQAGADRRKFQDAEMQRSTIVGDENGYWLTQQIEQLQANDLMLQTHEPKRFSFLGDDGEAVMAGIESSNSAVVIAMPGGCKMYRLKGHDFSSWVFRVEGLHRGSVRFYLDLAYRRIDTGAYMLYLRDHEPVR